MNMIESTYPDVYLYRRVVNAKLYIEHNFFQPINLEDIADEACFSKFHFIRLFKSIYRKTPHQYLICVRLEKARQFLQLDYSVTDTCFEVGFDSITSFIGLFKKSQGQTPASYQRAYRQRQTNINRSPLHFIPNCFAEQNGWKQNSNFQEVF